MYYLHGIYLKIISFINRMKLLRKQKQLIQKGILIQIESYEQYKNLVKEIRKNSKNRIFTNCYMLPGEIQRLIELKNLYQVKTAQGLVLVDDEGAYYHTVFFVDLTEPLLIPSLEKDILVENIYYEGRKTKAQEEFEQFLVASGCTFLNTYRSLENKPSLSHEKFYKKLAVLEKTLELEGKKIAIPTYAQLPEFEKVYRRVINKYVQIRFTRKERRAQADAGYLYCVTDDKGEIYAFAIRACVHGGAYGSRPDCQNNIYAPILLFYLFKNFYDNAPTDPVEREAYMKSNGIGGWIAVDNAPSWRVHKMLGIKAMEKSMSQFIIKSTM